LQPILCTCSNQNGIKSALDGKRATGVMEKVQAMVNEVRHGAVAAAAVANYVINQAAPTLEPM
jgi:hypothetical protein